MADKDKTLSSYSFLLLGHYATFAEADMMFDYLIDCNAKAITKIKLPLPELPYLKRIEITIHEKGLLKESKSMFSFVKPVGLAYVLQALQLLFIVFFSKRTYDIVIAQDSLVTFLGIIFRIFGKCKKVIFFSHGIDRQRFTNAFLNYFYGLLESFSARQSDFNWFLSKKMIPIRKKQGISDEKLFWIPSTVPIKAITRKKTGRKSTVVFLGTIDEKNGAQLLPEIISQVKRSVSDVLLDVMGEGPLFEEVSKQIKKKNLEKHIVMLGHLPFAKFSHKLTDYKVGIAPYAYSEKTLTSLSDSLKMRLYIAAGLPVVITKGYSFSDEILENNLGFATRQNVDSFAKAITKLLKDKRLNQEIRNRALVYSEKMDLTGFYDRAFTKVLQTM